MPAWMRHRSEGAEPKTRHRFTALVSSTEHMGWGATMWWGVGGPLVWVQVGWWRLEVGWGES